jgi:APA family basic amino acid/polyamine antiporter
MEQRHFYCRRDGNQKNIPRSLFLGTDCHRYLYPGKFAYLALLPMHGTPGASDIAGNGIMFASNDRVGAAAAYDYG